MFLLSLCLLPGFWASCTRGRLALRLSEYPTAHRGKASQRLSMKVTVAGKISPSRYWV